MKFPLDHTYVVFPNPECIESELRHLNEVMAPAALEKLQHELWAMFPLGRGLGGCWIGGTNYR
jgi:hypothetical protein